MRKIVNRYGKIAIYMALLVTVAFLTQSFVSGKKAGLPKGSLTGENLFRSIYFDQGILGGRLEILKSIADPHQNHDAKMIDKLISVIKEKDPTFFNDFKADVTSDNLLRVEKGLLAGRKEINTLAYRPTPLNASASKSADDQVVLLVIDFGIVLMIPQTPCGPLMIPFDPYVYIVAYVMQQGVQDLTHNHITEKGLFTEKLAMEVTENFSAE